MFWHGGFPLLVIAYALLKGEARDTTVAATGMAVLASVAAVLVAVCGLTLLATAGQNALPAIMQGNHYTPAMIVVVSSVWVLSLVALVVLWRRRPHSVLDLWLMVVMCAWIFDIALSAVLNAGRFDLGFYAGRIYGLLAASFVLIVLLLENNALYARLAETHENERRKSAELMAANKDLDAFSHSVAQRRAKVVRDRMGERIEILVRRHQLGALPALVFMRLGEPRIGRQPLRTRPVELDDLVNQVIDELRAGCAGRSIEFAVGRLGTAVADPALLKQVLANLLGNAIKFTREKNPAVVEVGCRKDADTGAASVYYVKDNGAGFDMRYSEKLFGVFQRLHRAEEYEGTGVGLSVVQRVINRHGGRVWADSRPGEGATFYFTLAPGS